MYYLLKGSTDLILYGVWRKELVNVIIGCVIMKMKNITGGIMPRYGQLLVGHTRTDRPCGLCGEEMKAGTEYAAMVYFNVGVSKKKSFTIRLHWDCLRPWTQQREVQKAEYRREKRWDKVPRQGRPPTGATEEQLKERKKIQFYLFDCKKGLLRSYENGDPERIRGSWLRVAKWLHEYGNEERVGPTNRFSFGPEVQTAVEDYEGLAGGREFTNKLAAVEGDPKGLAAVIRGIFGYEEESTDDTMEESAP